MRCLCPPGWGFCLLTQLGDDPFGHKIIDELAACGIDTSHICLTDKANTALAFVSLEADGNRTSVFYRKPSADLLYAPEQVDTSLFANAMPCIFLQRCPGGKPHAGSPQKCHCRSPQRRDYH